MDIEEFRKNGYKTIDLICDYFKDIESRPVQSQVKPGDISSKFPKDAPQDPESWDAVLRDVQEIIMPGLTNWNHPSFFAFFPSQTSFPAMLGDLLSSGFGQQGMMWMTSPACTEVEMVVMDWLAKLINLPEKFFFASTGGGVIQGSASDAVVIATVAAKFKKIKQLSGMTEDEITSKLVVYTSDQAHSSIKKACIITGIALSRFRALPTTAADNYALNPNTLSEAIRKDKEAGLIPFFCCATIGTTASTAIDPIDKIGEICVAEGLWFHIDAAYAGSACICPEYQYLLKGMENVNSFNMNPHKWLMTTFDCSAFWVDNKTDLTSTMNVVPEYLRNNASESGAVIDFRDWQLPLGRRFRSLKLYSVLKTVGVKGLQTMIRNHIQFAKDFEILVRKDDRFEIVQPRTFALICLRVKGSNELNKKLEEILTASGKVLLSHGVLDGVYYLRFSVGAWTTTYKHVETAWEVIKQETEKLLTTSQ